MNVKTCSCLAHPHPQPAKGLENIRLASNCARLAETHASPCKPPGLQVATSLLQLNALEEQEATTGIATRDKDATRGSWPYY